MYVPKRIFVHDGSKSSSKAKLIVANARKINPSVLVQPLSSGAFKYPPDLITAKDKFEWMKDTLIIRPRIERFIKTFASPGDIVEKFTTILNFSWMCAYGCEYCYLQTTRPSGHSVYTNIDKMKRELHVAPYSHWVSLTVWSMLSMALKKPLPKIPPGLRILSDDLREKMTDIYITSDRDAIDFIHLKQHTMFDALKASEGKNNINFTVKSFIKTKGEIRNIYQMNKDNILKLTSSEFNDLLAVDHLTEYTTDLNEILDEVPSLLYSIRTKSSNVDNLIRYDGRGRVDIQIGFNTERSINQYEHGTARFDERFDAARRIQDAKGYNLSIIIEPIIRYENYEEEYSRLVQKITKELHLNKVEKITIGAARYRKQLRAMILKHYPSTDLFDDKQELREPEGNDHRMRYRYEEREKIYRLLYNEIRKYSDVPVVLGAEHPGLWTAIDAKPEEHLAKTIYQYSGDNMSKDYHEEVGTSGHEDTHNDIKEQLLALSEPQNTLMSEDLDCAFSAMAPADETTDEDRLMASDRYMSRLTIESAWDEVDTMEASKTFHNEKIWNPVKFVGKILNSSDIQPVRSLTSEDEKIYSVRRLSLQGSDGTTVDSLALRLDKFQNVLDIERLIRTQSNVLFYGTQIPVRGRKKSYFRFFIHSMSVDFKPSDLTPLKFDNTFDPKFTINLSKGGIVGMPIDHPYSIVVKHKAGNGIIEYLKNELIDILGIKGMEKAPTLNKALEFVILQSFSYGRDQHSLRMHGLFLGPAGVGKSFLTQSAAILNEKCEQVSSSKAKITSAGLIGSVTKKKGHSVSSNGILPRNNGGTVCIQDFHEVRGGTRQQVCGIFSQMMEDGEVTDSTSAGVTLQAEVSLHLDMNRYSQVEPGSMFNTYTDIGIPINVLSRFDTIMEFERDVERQKAVGVAMVTLPDGIKSGVKGDQSERRIRFLRQLIVWMKDTYDVVFRPSDEIQDYLRERFESMLNNYRDRVASSTIWEDFQTRISRSVVKMLKAVVCANGSYEITKENIDYVLKFVEPKLEFLCSFKIDDIQLSRMDPQEDQDWSEVVGLMISKNPMTRREIYEGLKEKVSEKMIQRALNKKLGARYDKRTKKWSEATNV